MPSTAALTIPPALPGSFTGRIQTLYANCFKCVPSWNSYGDEVLVSTPVITASFMPKPFILESKIGYGFFYGIRHKCRKTGMNIGKIRSSGITGLDCSQKVDFLPSIKSPSLCTGAGCRNRPQQKPAFPTFSENQHRPGMAASKIPRFHDTTRALLAFSLSLANSLIPFVTIMPGSEADATTTPPDTCRMNTRFCRQVFETAGNPPLQVWDDCRFTVLGLSISSWGCSILTPIEKGFCMNSTPLSKKHFEGIPLHYGLLQGLQPHRVFLPCRLPTIEVILPFLTIIEVTFELNLTSPPYSIILLRMFDTTFFNTSEPI